MTMKIKKTYCNDLPELCKVTGFTGRRDIFKTIEDTIEQGETSLVLNGAPGVGKSAILNRTVSLLKKKQYKFLVFRGIVSPELFLGDMYQAALEEGTGEVENLFNSLIEYKHKLEKILELFIYKHKFAFIFEDFDENQNTEGKLINDRLNELLIFLKGTFKDKGSLLIFCSQYQIPKFDSIQIEPLNWNDFREMIDNTKMLQQLDKKSLKQFHFDTGGYPAIIEYAEIIAAKEFKNQQPTWSKILDTIPDLATRIQYKENESADFSYLLVEKLLQYLNNDLMDIMKSLSVFKGRISSNELDALHTTISPAQQKKLEDLGLLFYSQQTRHYYLSRLTSRILHQHMTDIELKEKHLLAARYYEECANLKRSEDEIITDITFAYYMQKARFHYLEAGELEKGTQFTFLLDRYLCRIGFPQWAFDLVQSLEKYIPQLQEPIQLQIRLRLAMLLSIFGKLDEAIVHYSESLPLIHLPEERTVSAYALGQMGMLYDAKGKYDEALTYYHKSLEELETLDEKKAIVQKLDQMGMIYKRQGNYNDANSVYLRALEINRNLGDQKGEAACLELLGQVFDEQAKFEEALDYYRQSLTLKEQLNDKKGISELIHQMGNVHFVWGKLDEALPLYRQALALREELQDYKGAGYSMGQIGLVLQRKEMNDDALIHYEKSLEYFEKAGEQKGMAAGNHQIGRMQEMMGNRDKAITYYEKAIQIREQNGDTLGAAITYGQMGLLYFDKEELETALRYSSKAFSIFSQFGSPNMEVAKRNMLRIRSRIPIETFNNILREYNINPEPQTRTPGNDIDATGIDASSQES